MQVWTTAFAHARWMMLVLARSVTCSCTFNSTMRSKRSWSLGNGIHFSLVQAIDILDVAQPLVDDAQWTGASWPLDPRRSHSGRRRSRASPSGTFHGVLQHAQQVQVGVHHHVGDVAVHEDLAQAGCPLSRWPAHDYRCIRSRGTPGCTFDQAVEELGIALAVILGPSLVVQ
jgi:hypothetical protein